jgi:hypothetical protein
MPSAFTPLLTEALQKVADAHEAFQAEHGPDADWPRWYAQRLTAGISDDREQLEEIMFDALNRAGTDHGVFEAEVLHGVHDAEWPAWYAENMANTLGANAPRLEPGIRAFLAEQRS